MKVTREVKIGALALICAGILYFGFNFLKGVNVFVPTHCYYGAFEKTNGLTTQAPVYILGHKVGLVENIAYDFSQQPAFMVAVSIDDEIVLPRGTEMCLVADGLLGGAAIELKLPTLGNRAMPYQKGDTLQTTIVAGLVESMQNGVMAQLDSLLQAANQLMLTLNGELEDGSLHHSLKHIEQLTADLTVSGKDIRQLTHTQLPEMMTKVDTTLADLQMIVSAVRKAEVEQTIETLNATITSLNEALASEEGTVGMLLNDKELYENLNTALKDLDQVVLNVDSVVTSIKARPFIQKKLKK